MKKTVVTTLSAIALGMTAHAAFAQAKFDVQLVNGSMSGSDYDSMLSQQELNAAIGRGFQKAGITPNYVHARSNNEYWLKISISQLYIASSATRVLVIQNGVRDDKDRELCSIDTSFWWAGPSGPMRLKENLEGSVAQFVRACLK